MSCLASGPNWPRSRSERSARCRSPTKGSERFDSRVRKIIERNTLTPEDLESGAWREIKLRPYDVKLAAQRRLPRQDPSAPQDHRANAAGVPGDGLCRSRLADGRVGVLEFRRAVPAAGPPGPRHAGHVLHAPPGRRRRCRIAKVVEPVRRTHEDGWETGSEGWGYKWSPERSKQVVLRTHTTAATIRALAANPNPPGKFFCVGWTYRNETISFKHLPVFHQVDGIIIDEEANLASLMGTLQEFYSKMGFGRVKFKPAFYPYTEPSVDVVVYMESRGKWLEMGGAGIFRPEVTLPLGCKYPVLAWGLGIERLAMLRFGLSDIRELYGTEPRRARRRCRYADSQHRPGVAQPAAGQAVSDTETLRESLEQIGCDVEDVVDIELQPLPAVRLARRASARPGRSESLRLLRLRIGNAVQAGRQPSK